MLEPIYFTKKNTISYSNKFNNSENSDRNKSLPAVDVYVYCPNDEVERIRSVLARHNIQFQINNYNAKPSSDITICHYKSARLKKEERLYLIKMTELGAWVEPLDCYLERYLGLTEIELLYSGYFLHYKAFALLSNKCNQITKRFLDIVSVVLLFFIAVPIGCIIALLIKIESPGPVFLSNGEQVYIIKNLI